VKRIDHIGVFAVDVPVDIGWAICVLHRDQTFSRTCKGCGVGVRSPIAGTYIVNSRAGKERP
jgi:hypothetical protein